MLESEKFVRLIELGQDWGILNELGANNFDELGESSGFAFEWVVAVFF